MNESQHEKLYRLLISLYPQEHRREFEVSMLQIYRDLYREYSHSKGIFGVLKLWSFIIKDLSISLFREHYEKGDQYMSSTDKRLALFGAVALLIPLYFVTAGIIFSLTGIELNTDYIQHPLIILGSIVLAFLLNLFSVFKVKISTDGVPSVNLSLKLKVGNVLVVGISILLVAIIFVYLLFENVISVLPK